MLPALRHIESIAATREQLQRDPGRLARLQVLQRWQVARLKSTYADLFALPRYRDAIAFFTQDLYGPHDFAQRDRDLKRVLEPWQRVLPARAMQAVTSALQLEHLTQVLDLAVLDVLGGQVVDADSYALAYRKVGRPAERQVQIELIVGCGRKLDALVANPWVHRTLRLAKLPARLGGISTLHEFLERGYAAFAKLGGAQTLLHTVEKRETLIMRNLFSGRPDPFSVAPAQTHLELTTVAAN